MRKTFALLALLLSTLWAAPALAAPSPTFELAAWVRSNTDLSVSQIAITGPDNVYSLEPLGPPLPTGEVLALVRTEAMSPDWGDTHQFQSWDAHMLLDCEGGRVRVLRSASYPERDRQGPAKSDERGDSWFTPEAKTPAATLLAAACDPNFSWPLRADPAAAPSKATPLGGPSYLQKAATVSPAPAKAAVEPRLEKTSYVTHRASDAAFERANLPLQQVSFTSGPVLQPPVAALPEAATAQRHGMFATAVAATRTCRRLAGAGRSWLVRRVEVAFRRDAPSRPDAGLIRQAELS